MANKTVSQVLSLTKKLVAFATPKLKVFMKYAKVELVPPTTPSEFKEIGKSVGRLISAAKAQRFRQVTVKEAWLNAVVTTEVVCWFYVGECIGKRHIVGYDV